MSININYCKLLLSKKRR